MKELLEKSLDPQLWHACAGSMVQIPPLNSKIIYFPQGHAEHCQSPVDFPFSSAAAASKIPASILCRVAAVRFLADPETDEVYTKMSLVPLPPNAAELDFGADEIELGSNSGIQENPASFAKTLTQSDANNGGGFSVPRYCAETIFPRLDYSADPPVQTVLAKDVHGEVWKFRHIYRGTPRRHLLTTGWSTFVNQKKLVAGDSIVFLRAENGDLCVGIRRAKRGFGGSSSFPPQSGWGINTNTYGAGGMGNNPYGNFSLFLKEDENKAVRNGGKGSSSPAAAGKVKPEDVLEAARLAASGRPFDVYYYPRASTPEFCVKASSARAAMRIHWCPGMRFKMPFETEDSSRISWFMATVASVQVADPIRWPNSPWRLLQVTWDEPEMLQNVKRVSPWLVEPVTNIPMIQPSGFSSPPRKKFRFPTGPLDFPLDGQFQLPSFSGSNNNPLSSSSSPLYYLSDNSAPAGIQGARHAHIGVSLSDLHHLNHNKLPQPPSSGSFLRNLQQFNPPPPAPPSTHSRFLETGSESLSCLLTIGNGNSSSSSSPEKPSSYSSSSSQEKKKQFFLFGQPILTEQQISHNRSGESISRNAPDEKQLSSEEKSSSAGGGHSSRNQSCLSDGGSQTCKVFIESEDAGRTIDLTAFASYEELYTRLANMLGMERTAILNHVVYRDTAGVVKRTGDEPFSLFSRTASRVTILINPPRNDNVAR
ncbi:unnamed protein product [Linum tenue]|nr:unnamed protein product [Linum tenue]